jgi:hypothetical protein
MAYDQAKKQVEEIFEAYPCYGDGLVYSVKFPDDRVISVKTAQIHMTLIDKEVREVLGPVDTLLTVSKGHQKLTANLLRKKYPYIYSIYVLPNDTTDVPYDSKFFLSAEEAHKELKQGFGSNDCKYMIRLCPSEEVDDKVMISFSL